MSRRRKVERRREELVLIDLAEFVYEAKHDLEIVSIIVAHKLVKQDNCEDDTFYYGRRAVNMLQQTVEKPLKPRPFRAERGSN